MEHWSRCPWSQQVSVQTISLVKCLMMNHSSSGSRLDSLLWPTESNSLLISWCAASKAGMKWFRMAASSNQASFSRSSIRINKASLAVDPSGWAGCQTEPCQVRWVKMEGWGNSLPGTYWALLPPLQLRLWPHLGVAHPITKGSNLGHFWFMMGLRSE